MAVDFEKMKRDIREAVCEILKAALPVPMGEMVEEMYMPWIAAFTDKYVVIELGMDYWQVPYTYDKSGIATVSAQADWAKVEPQQNWVEATKARKPAGWVKAVEDSGEWLLDVLVPYGGPKNGKDNDGDWFSPNTDFWLDQIPKRPLIHYHGWDTKGQPAQPEVIGEELNHTKASDGVWFRYKLDKAKQTAKEMWEAAKAGFARASSGAISHLVRPTNQHGHIDLWPIAENSIMDTRKGNIPVNSYAVALPVVKATYKAANLNLTIDESEASAEPQQGAGTPADEEVNTLQEISPMATESTPLTLEQIAAFLDKRDADKAEAQRIKDLEQIKVEHEALKAQIAEVSEARTGKEQIKRVPNPAQEPDAAQQISVSSKWDGFTVGQLGQAYDMLKAVRQIPSAGLYRALHAKALKMVDSPEFYANHIVRNQAGEIMREFSPDVSQAAVKAVKAINPMQMADSPAVKSDELMYSTQASYGDEWVPTLWSTELWDLVRNGAPVLSRFQQVEVPGETLTIPALGGRTTLYKVAQTTDQADLTLTSALNATLTKAATSNVALTPVKGMAVLVWSGELSEDSIVPILPTLQASLQMDLMEQIDEILISGDTDTANTNISDTGNGSISAAWHLLIANGLRDYALGNSNATDIGTLTAEDFLAIMGLLGTNGAFAIDPAKLFWLSDPGFYRTAMALGETLTRDKNSAATIESGRLTKVFGSDFIISDKYGKTDSSGKIHNTTNNNTKGSVLLVRPDRWKVGFGRRLTIKSPSPDLLQMATDTNALVASFRLAFKNNGEGSALGYNATLVG